MQISQRMFMIIQEMRFVAFTKKLKDRNATKIQYIIKGPMNPVAIAFLLALMLSFIMQWSIVYVFISFCHMYLQKGSGHHVQYGVKEAK